MTGQKKQHQEPKIGNYDLIVLFFLKVAKCLDKIQLSHLSLDLSENGSRVYCAGEPLSPEQLRKASQLYFLPNVVFTSKGKCRFKPPTIWDQLFITTVSGVSFWYIFWQDRVCWRLLCLCHSFSIFERCLDANPESCRSKQARYQLSHPYHTSFSQSSPSLSHPSPPNLATHLPPT